MKTRDERTRDLLDADPALAAACAKVGSEPGRAPCLYPDDLKKVIDAYLDALWCDDMESAPKDQRVMVELASGKVYIARYVHQKFYKKPKPYWQWDGGLGVEWNRSDQPVRWKPVPAGKSR